MVNILRYRWISLIFSAAILIAAGIKCVHRLQTTGQIFTYSVDFTGGTQVLLKFNKPISEAEVNTVLTSNWPSTTTRKFEEDEYLIRVSEFSNDPQGLAGHMVEALKAAYPDYEIEILENEAVGAGVGSELRSKFYRAIIIALGLMLGYIALRFYSIGFALGSLAALCHDALIVLAVFLLLDREISISVISSLLAVIGYSINDTIVIYSQIRENLKSLKRHAIYDIVNISLNQTMRRTILTSITTALSVLAILLLGGEALRSFSLAFLVGIIFGTYSSIYIASPIVMWFHKDRVAA